MTMTSTVAIGVVGEMLYVFWILARSHIVAIVVMDSLGTTNDFHLWPSVSLDMSNGPRGTAGQPSLV